MSALPTASAAVLVSMTGKRGEKMWEGELGGQMGGGEGARGEQRTLWIRIQIEAQS